ncbi:MAG TPA: EAL domain-containing protein [Steroidobacteraceae bacterium]|jgi:EAL domain-containing protein (putative c-di-GMP-specific phosphodiesterase class I)|nr:EAL domain-containing protein [Steroidobacteraceae bacterium]
MMGFLDTPPSAKNGANATASGSAPAESRERRFNTDDISKQLLRILQPLHVDSLSLHDGAGELLWLNEGAFGPDEHGVVLDALDVFALDADREDLQLKLDDDRTALCACARSGGGEVLGIALTIVETPASEEFAAKLAAPRLSGLMRRLAQLLAPSSPAAPHATGPAAAASAVPAASKKRAEAISFSDSEDITEELEADPRPRQVVVPRERRTQPAPSAKVAARSGTIHARRYARLRAGGAARRYEVKLAPNASFAADFTLATRVVEHLQRSGDRYTQTPSSFAIPLSTQSVTQAGWLSKLQPILARANLPDHLIGFCLPPAAWDQELEATRRFIGECEEQRCFVALDDFTLGSYGLTLLQSTAVKCLKLDGILISSVVNDKFAHATLAAIVQAARVLGLYCVAKQVSSASDVKWLAAAGIEFADGVSRGLAVAATMKSDDLSVHLGE